MTKRMKVMEIRKTVKLMVRIIYHLVDEMTVVLMIK